MIQTALHYYTSPAINQLHWKIVDVFRIQTWVYGMVDADRGCIIKRYGSVFYGEIDNTDAFRNVNIIKLFVRSVR